MSILSIKTESYNERRYGKPYIASVIFEKSKAVFNFGEWVGEKGSEGILEIEINEGDIVARGQKDFNGKNSAPRYYIVKSGELEECSKAEAYEYSKSKKEVNPLEGFTLEQLQKEIERRQI